LLRIVFVKTTCKIYDIPPFKQSQEWLQGVWFNFFERFYV